MENDIKIDTPALYICSTVNKQLQDMQGSSSFKR